MTRFAYSVSDIASLESSISPARLSTYERLVNNGSKSDALDLYAMNAQLSGAFIFSIQALEITLRNKCATVLANRFGNDWLTNGAIAFMQWQQEEIAKASLKGQPGIDLFHFAFWQDFFTKHYYQLWTTDLHGIFARPPQGFTRRKFFAILERTRLFRNRVAHHEQIIGYDPVGLQQNISDVISWLDPGQSAWFQHHCQVLNTWNVIQAEKNSRRWTGF